MAGWRGGDDGGDGGGSDGSSGGGFADCGGLVEMIMRVLVVVVVI